MNAKTLSVAGMCVAAALMAAPSALADPVELPPAPPPAADAAQPAAAPAPAPPEGVSHLPSPDALRPGTTMDPNAAKPLENPNVSFLKDLWQAVQNKEISGKEAAIIAFSQRGMNTPYPEQAPAPYTPISPVDAAAALPPAPPEAPAAPAPAPASPALPPPPPAPGPPHLMPWLP